MTCPPSWPRPTSLLTESILSTTQKFCFWKLATFSFSYILKQNKVILEKKLCLYPHWPSCNLMTVLSILIMFLLSSHLWEEKAMATHSSTFAWKIPWMEEPGRLQSVGWGSQTRLSSFTFTFHFHALEKEMATHSSVLAWRIPGMGELGGLLSVGSYRDRHDWSDLVAAESPGALSQGICMIHSFPSFRSLLIGNSSSPITQQI